MRSFFFLYVGIDCYKIYSLELLLLNPISFSMLYLHFHLFPNIFWFPFWLHLWLIGYSEVYCLNSTYLKIFQFSFFFKLLSSFILFGPIKMLGMISILLNLLKLALWSIMWSIMENIMCVLRRMFLLLLLDVLYSIYVQYSIYVCQIYLLYSSS